MPLNLLSSTPLTLFYFDLEYYHHLIFSLLSYPSLPTFISSMRSKSSIKTGNMFCFQLDLWSTEQCLNTAEWFCIQSTWNSTGSSPVSISPNWSATDAATATIIFFRHHWISTLMQWLPLIKHNIQSFKVISNLP